MAMSGDFPSRKFELVDQSKFSHAMLHPTGCALAVGRGNIIASVARQYNGKEGSCFRSKRVLLNFLNQEFKGQEEQ
jgi:hypothetical protein